MTEHFATAPGWEWWILGYFFVAGIAGGSFALGAMLRWWGGARDAAAARLAFLVSFPAVVLCPVLLTVDLGQPFRFWHMLVDRSGGGLAFKLWSPMSVGSWALLVFGGLAFLAFVEAAGWIRWPRALSGAVTFVGAIFGLFVAGYTGVLLAVSNQPLWSDGWPLAGMFLASGLSGAAGLLLLLRARGPAADGSLAVIAEADRWFVILEGVLAVLFLVSVAAAGWLGRALGGGSVVLWLVVALGIAAPFLTERGGRRLLSPQRAALLTLVGVFALRAVVIFSAQG